MGRKTKQPTEMLYKIKSIKLDACKKVGIQLSTYRKHFNYSLKAFGEKAGIEPSNLWHYENNTHGFKSDIPVLSETTVKYLKALGVQEVIIKL